MNKNLSVEDSNKLFELNLAINNKEENIDIIWFRLITRSQDFFVDPHFHSTFEIHYSVFGNYSVTVENILCNMEPGQFLIIPPEAVHSLTAVDETFQRFVINFQIKSRGDDIETLQLIEALNSVEIRPFKSNRLTDQLFHYALEEAVTRSFGFIHSLKSYIMLILFNLVREVSGNVESILVPETKQSPDEIRARMVERYLEEQPDNIRIKVPDIAQYLHVSQKQLCRVLANKRGKTPFKLIAEEKIKRAKRLLRDSDMPLVQIAETLGFTNEYYFNRFFRREEGLPPGNFRVSQKGKNTEL